MSDKNNVKSDHAEETAPLEPVQSKGGRKVKKAYTFDDVLNQVGSQGRYQKIILYGFVVPFSAVMPLFILNMVFMLSEPDHWCHVPGQFESNYSLEAWKNLTIPMIPGSDGQLRFSQCSMYTDDQAIVPCSNGWEYDRTDYKGTIPTDFDWVCEKSSYATQALTANSVGSAAGAVVFGWAGDKIGRKIVFMLCIAMNFLFRIVSLYVPQHFEWFLLIQFLVGTAYPMIYVSSFAIVAEVCGNEFRSSIYSMSWIAFVSGICVLPLIAWIIGDWYYIGGWTMIPLAFVALYYFMIPESPRWLLTVGRIDEAEVILKKIAKTNGTLERLRDNDDIRRMLNELKHKQDQGIKQSQGLWALFTKRRVAKNTILLSIVWAMNQMVYYGITLNTTSMAGNQFVNFFILSIVELPTGAIGAYFVERTGRRWTQVVFFILCMTGFIISIVGIYATSYTTIIMALLISKFSVAITSLVVILQATELFPTQLRSTGTGFASTVGSVTQIFSPYIIFLGRVHAAIPYFGMAIVSAIGMFSSSMLPETFKQSLPETLEDAENLGKTAEFWSFLPKDYKAARRRSSIAVASDYANSLL